MVRRKDGNRKRGKKKEGGEGKYTQISTELAIVLGTVSDRNEVKCVYKKYYLLISFPNYSLRLNLCMNTTIIPKQYNWLIL